MEINKHNYEAYFLDYHEGNLTPQEVAELLLFVEQHPEIKEQFESFENISLDEIPSVHFQDRASLKKEINSSTIDDFLIKDTEGVISKAEKELLNSYIQQHPQIKKELELYNKTKLSPDHSVVFENKENLKAIPELLLTDSDSLLISSIEGVLSKEEEMLLTYQLKADRQLNKEYELFLNTKLVPDQHLVYPNKDELKRSDRVAAISFYYYVAAAAAILLLFGLFSIFDHKQEQKFANSKLERVLPSTKKNNIVSPSSNLLTKENIAFVKENSLSSDQKKNAVSTESKKLKSNEQVLNKGVVAVDQNQQPLIANNIHNNELTQEKENILTNTILPSVEQKQQPALALTDRSSEKEYLSLKEIAVAKIKEKALDEEALVQQKKSGKIKKLSGWDLAQLVAKGVSKLTGKDVNVAPTYNDAGEVTAYALNAGKLEISRGR